MMARIIYLFPEFRCNHSHIIWINCFITCHTVRGHGGIFHIANVQSELVAARHKILIRCMMLRLNVFTIRQRQILFWQLIKYLLFAISFAGRIDFRHFVVGQRIKKSMYLQNVSPITVMRWSIRSITIQSLTFAAVRIPGGTHAYPNCFPSIFDVCVDGFRPNRSRTDVTCSW